jgi:hypothetical protein
MFNPKPTAKFRGKYLYTESSAAAIGVLSLTPLNLDARCVSITDAFMLYRFTKLRFHIVPTGGAGYGIFALGYTPAIPTTGPGNGQQVLDCAVSSFGNGSVGFPLPHLNLTRKTLMTNAPKWFRRGTGYDDLLELQGQIYYWAQNNFNVANVLILIEWEIEVASPLATADTMRGPARDPALANRLQQLRQESKEKDLADIKRIDDYASRPQDDPILDRIKDLLLRDDMVVVGSPNATTNMVTGRKPV